MTVVILKPRNPTPETYFTDHCLLTTDHFLRHFFAHDACFTAGGCHVPSPGGRIEGASVFGEYRRITR